MKPVFSNNKCTISDDWAYKAMQVIYMENDLLKIGILAGRGSDIFEFRYKPLDLDFLLRLPKGIKNPARDFSQMRNTASQFEDYYYGGWQEILPNSHSFNYRAASLGQHGEVALIPWKYAITKNEADEVAVKLWVQPLRVPIYIEKTLTLKAGEAKLCIKERLVNQAETSLDIMWGHHIAFGLPFLEAGAVVETNADTMEAEPSMPANRRFLPHKKFQWPHAENMQGQQDDARIIPAKDASQYSDLCYLKSFQERAYYSIKNEKENIGFGLTWDKDVFKCLWLWQERNATKDFPWWGQCYTVALEPWTSAGTDQPEEAIDQGEWLHLAPGETVNTELVASAFQDSFNPY